MNSKWINIISCWLLTGMLAFAEDDADSTNNVAVVKHSGTSLSTNDVKAVAAMAVVEAGEAVEAAEVAEIVRRAEAEKKSDITTVDIDPWDAFEPPPDTKYDWIQLTSREWLKGEFKVMYDHSLEFDSDEMDLQEFDLEDVKRVRTRGMKTVLVQGDGGRRDTSLLRGMLEIRGDEVILRRSEYEVTVLREDVISIAGGRQRERDYWSGMVSLGINARGGNTETVDTTIMANVQRRTASSRFNADYLANYSETGELETANNQRLSGFYDRFLTARFYWQILAGEYYRDPFTNIDGQYSLSSGLGYDLIHTSKTEWGFGLGVGYQEQKFVSVELGKDDSSTSPFATIGTRFDREVTGNIDYLFDYGMRWLNEENGQYTHHMLTTLSVDLISDLDLDISFIWDRIEKPQADADGKVPKQDDYQLIVSLAYDF